MKLENLKVNRIRTPLGFTLESPSFSWTVEDTAATRQRAARVIVSLQRDMSDPVWDSGKTADLCSLGVEFPVALAPRTRYWWQVTVWGDNGESATAQSWFETGKLCEGWQGEWITVPSPLNKLSHPYFAKEFTLPADPVCARLYCTAHGIYEASVNGTKAGEEFLTPDCNNYHHFLQAQTYDVTALLHSGVNRVGSWVGPGWYAGRFGFLSHEGGLWGDDVSFVAELHIDLADGTHITVCTDESWLCHASGVFTSGIYDGEERDARNDIPNWCCPESGWDGWLPVQKMAAPAAPVEDRWSLPVRIMQRWHTAEVLTTPAGETVVDFKQEMTGWVEFTCDAPAGTEIFLQFGEILQGGNFYNDNLRTAKAQFRYISDGVKRVVRPHFTFFGFRYMKVTGMEKVTPDTFTALVLHSDMDATGDIVTDNEKVNRLIANVQWGQRGNFVDVPTDCPQRDERLGWTGDTEVFSSTANFNMDTAAFYSKFMHDMLYEQKLHNGGVPHVVPDILNIIYILENQPENISWGSCAWGDAGTIVPWNTYLYFGGKNQLAREYENMKRWVDYIRSRDEDICGGIRLWACDFHFADWLAMDNPDKQSCFGATDPYYVASGYYYWSARLLSKAARALGKAEDEAAYFQLAEEVKTAIRKEYFTATGRLAIPTQTALAMSLYMDFAPEQFRDRQIKDLAKHLDDRKGYLDTGFVGTYQLCSALSENGEVERMYTLLLNEELPSWLYEVNMGATTIWERWNSVLPDGYMSDTGMNSLNHYSYGAVMEWMYRYMCGLNPVEDAPGFKKAVIRPMPDKRFDHVSAVYHSAAGLYRSGWQQTAEGIRYTVQVPFDAEAEFVLTAKATAATVNGAACPALTEQGKITLTAGSYEIITACAK